MQEGSRHGARIDRGSPKSPVLADTAAPNHIVVMAFARSNFWRDRDDESAFRDQFWRKVRHVAASIPFVEDLLTTYYCAFDKATPLPVKASLFGALAYFLLPTDAVPDVLPVLGFTDDAAMLATAVKLMASHIRPEHRAAAKAKLAEFSKA
jgi:uncharacterized membrane protein YkvA (DUF1232 family)